MFDVIGDQEQYLPDEPIPVLPAPSGVRPPPLFQSFSMLAAEFSEPFDANTALPDMKQLLFQLYKGNPRLKYTPRVNTVKLIVTGEAGMFYFTIFFHVIPIREKGLSSFFLTQCPITSKFYGFWYYRMNQILSE